MHASTSCSALLNGTLLTERVNLSGLCKTFIGIIRLWKLDNVVIPQQAVVNTGTQMSSQREKLSKTSTLAWVLLLCAQNYSKGVNWLKENCANATSRGFCALTGRCCLCAALRNLRVICRLLLLLLRLLTDIRKSVKNIFEKKKTSNFFSTSVPFVRRRALQTCKEQLKTLTGDRRWQA